MVIIIQKQVKGIINKETMFIILFILFILITISLSANTGSALIWTIAFHFFIGNFIIGVIEAIIIIKTFNTKKIKTVLIIIIANYISMFPGFFLIDYLKTFFHFNIYNLSTFFYIFIFLAFIITIIIELPFTLFILRKNSSPLIKKIKIFLIANLITYILMGLLYYGSSDLTILTDYKLKNINEISCSTDFNLYLIPINKKRYYKYNLINKKLMLDSKSYNFKEKEEEMHKYDFGYKIDTLIDNYNGWKIGKYGTFNRYVKYSNKNLHGSIGYETPYFTFSLMHITYIGNDCLIFEFNKQIFILNMKTKELALITNGTHPIVKLKE